MLPGQELESRITAAALFRTAFDSSIEIRLASVSALKHLAGWNRYDTDSVFIRLLQDENEFIVGMTLVSAEKILMPSDEITDAVRKASMRNSSFIRQKALQIFRSKNYRDVNFSEQILLLLKDSDPSVRAEAVMCVGDSSFSDPLSTVLPFLKDENAEVRAGAVKALERIRVNRDAVIAALKSVNADDEKVFRIAERILKYIDRLESHRTEEEGFSDELRKAKEAFESFSEDKEAALYESFLNMHSDIHIDAIDNALSADPEGRSVPFLIRSLSSKFSEVRHKAAHTLGRMGKKAVKSVPHLITALKDRNNNVRSWTVYALGEIGEKELSCPALLPLLLDSDEMIRKKTAGALGKIKDIRALPYIINEFKNGENSSEFYYSLEKFGKSAEFVLPEFLNIYYTKPSRGMAEVLSNMALESESCRKDILDNFIRMFKERQIMSSLEGIAGMGRYAERAVPLLLETVHNKKFYKDSMYALACIGTEEAFSALISNLDDFNLVQTLKRLKSESSAERITAVLELSQLAVNNSRIDEGFL